MDVIYKLRTFLLAKNWNAITVDDWIRFLSDVNRPEFFLLCDLVGDGFIKFIESKSLTNKEKIDLLRKKVGLQSSDEQDREDAARRRRVKMRLHLEKEAKEEAENKQVDRMFDYDDSPAGDLPREVANKALEGEGRARVFGGMDLSSFAPKPAVSSALPAPLPARGRLGAFEPAGIHPTHLRDMSLPVKKGTKAERYRHLDWEGMFPIAPEMWAIFDKIDEEKDAKKKREDSLIRGIMAANRAARITRPTGKGHGDDGLGTKLEALLTGAGVGDVLIPHKAFVKEHKNLLGVLKRGKRSELDAEYKDQASELASHGGSKQSAGFIRRMLGEVKVVHNGEYKPIKKLSNDSTMNSPRVFNYSKVEEPSNWLQTTFGKKKAPKAPKAPKPPKAPKVKKPRTKKEKLEHFFGLEQTDDELDTLYVFLDSFQRNNTRTGHIKKVLDRIINAAKEYGLKDKDVKDYLLDRETNPYKHTQFEKVLKASVLGGGEEM